MKRTVAWFSAGVSSAVATKLMINEIDEIIYTHIDDHDPDLLNRFVPECEQWFGKTITILQSPYKTVEEVCLAKRYINGVAGASCTGKLKREVRKQWEYEQPLNTQLRYVWGMDASKRERERAARLIEVMPDQQHVFPLIERGITKPMAHEILKASGIKRPLPYEQGFSNANCRGCVKGGQAYWDLVRKVHPTIYEARAKMEREIGASCINGIYLDELPEGAGRGTAPIADDCGILCELLALK